MDENAEYASEAVLKEIARLRELKGVGELIDNVSRNSGYGTESKKIQQLYAGLNILPNMMPAPVYKEMQGLVLFTKPDLNLSVGNIGNVRELLHLLNPDPNSVPNAVRKMLDPSTQIIEEREFCSLASNLVDPKLPYISLLSNTLATMSPPPDIGLSPYVTEEGIVKEQWMMNDSIAMYNGKFDITITNELTEDAGLLLMMHAWLTYMSYLRIGPVVPHPHNRIQDRMDYFTRIERYKFDKTGRYITQWWHCGAAFPTNLSIGAGFGFTREQAYETENKTISTQFACVGSVYQDPIQLYEFNIRMKRHNPLLEDWSRSSHYKKVPYALKAAMNGLCYPLINLATNEMEYWAEPMALEDVIKNV